MTTANTELPAPGGFDLTTFHDNEGDELGVVGHSRWQAQRLVAMSSLLLPAVLGRQIAAVVHTTTALVALPGRVAGLMTSAEQTLARIQAAVTRTDALLDRVEGVTGKADGVVDTASQAVTAAAVPVEQASTLTAGAAPLLERYSQLLRRLEPMARRLAETTESHEVDALVTLMERLPHLTDAMENNVIPLLSRLDQRGPDLNQLLDSVSDLNRMVNRLPKVFRRHHNEGP